MVASIKIIKAFSDETGLAYTGKYYTQPTLRSDGAFAKYVTEGGERVGEYGGSAVALLGLKGAVIPEHFARLLHRKDPHTGADLTKSRSRRLASKQKKIKQRKHQVAAVDVCFSLEKSISAFLVFAPPDIRRKVERLALETVREVLEGAENTLPLGRSGKAGREKLIAKLLAALFLHRASRRNQPNWHIHAVVLSMSHTEKGWTSVNTKTLRDWVRSLGPAFRAALNDKLREQLGLEFSDVLTEDGKKRGWARLDVPQELCDHWSDRSKEINAKTGADGAASDASSRAKAHAAKETRGTKEKLPPEPEWIAELKADARRFGFTERHALALLGRSTSLGTDQDYRSAFDSALSQLTESEAYFSHAKLVQVVAENLQACGFPAKELLRRVKHDLEHHQELRVLNPGEPNVWYTTEATWETEENCDESAKVLNDRPGLALPREIVDRLLSTRTDLSDEQRDACRHLLCAKGSLSILTGVAGSGKSRTLNTVREILEMNGKHVYGAALSGAAKEELAEKAHIESRTIASWLYHLEKSEKEKLAATVKHHAKQLHSAMKKKRTYRRKPLPKLTKDSVLIIDEAGMMDTALAYRLFAQAEKAHASVILVGDTAQIQPIGAGAVLARYKKKYGHFHLKENWRQFNARDQLVGNLVREGNALEALKDLHDRNELFVGATRTETIDLLVRAYVADGAMHRPKDNVAFTMTRAETRLLNLRLQQARIEAGLLDASNSISFHLEKFHVGDRVMAHEPLRQFGLENGYRGTVVRIDQKKRSVDVRFDQKVRLWTGKSPAANIVSLPLSELPKDSFSLSYAMTTHKGQGQDAKENAYVLLGGKMTDRELAYTQLTRARCKTRVFVDKLHSGTLLEDISRSVSRSRKKQMAHDIVEQRSLSSSMLALTLDVTENPS